MQTLLQRGLLLACLIVPAAAQSDDAAQIKIDNFTFGPDEVGRRQRHGGDLDQPGRYTAQYRSDWAWRPIKGTRYRQDFYLSVR